MHIAIVGGERVRIRLADDLREERSHSLSLSADLYHRFGKVQTNLLVEGFYTTLDHVFALRPLPDPDTDGSTIKERYNGSGARVMGINIEGKAAFTRWFDLQAGITLQQSRYKEPEQWSEDPEVAPTRKMFRTPNTYGYLTAELTPYAICRQPLPELTRAKCSCSTWRVRARPSIGPSRHLVSST